MDAASPRPQFGQSSSDALAEGRRVYVGNLLYTVKPVDIESLLADAGFGSYEKIHISVDPISGRNPGYCFVEFPTPEEAERALASLSGVELLGRAVKVGPCRPKAGGAGAGAAQERPRGRDPQPRPTFERWGDWNGERAAPKADQQQGPYGALRHLSDMKASEPDGRRLYVGGLGKMIDQAQNEAEVKELFVGFQYEAIGKRITPHPSTMEKPGNHHYCFVDFPSAEEAARALAATNGKEVPGGFLRVFPARGKAPASARDGIDDPETAATRPTAGGRGGFQRGTGGAVAAKKPLDDQEVAERNQRQRTIMEASSWRRGPAAQ
ncbi:hypothetical protein B0T26DRAFT_820060 [Lasiosphaeria miniovina]|uniref:RRM domain-containing protein n=1 Tax=Lasiosphaeria miniovina TaxID=1954250 RepID=A0AA40BIC6_9PEZI|nr:uncharacterized protein B0T26DRAFT_820060 [Lasiosphaeria miniovina]KAK0734761.1 hypothetical protein B0T26DRAFT_820060 [Lasiosphaeria miniovina]